MADVDQSVLVDAFVRWGELKGREALELIYEQALQNTLTGVQLTSVTFEGASGSGVAQSLDTAKLLVVVEQALQLIDGTFTSGRAVRTVYTGALEV